MIALLAVGWTLALLAGLFAVAAHRLVARMEAAREQQREREREFRDAYLDRMDAARVDERALGDRRLTDERAQHAAELARVNAAHEQALGNQMAAFASTLEGMMNMATFGRKEGAGEAVRVERVPDAEDRINAAIRDDTIEVGARRLQEEYKASGIEITIEDCRQEARSMLLGVSPREAGLPQAARDAISVLARD